MSKTMFCPSCNEWIDEPSVHSWGPQWTRFYQGLCPKCETRLNTEPAARYFEVLRPSDFGLCSDNACPCPEVRIPRGTGYLYVSRELVEFRQDCLTDEQLQIKVQHMAESDPLREFAMKHGAAGLIRIPRPGTSSPILMCEQGARLRRLDLQVAAADAKHWWETGLVPLRPTPLKSQ